jgi:exonuclease SbcC
LVADLNGEVTARTAQLQVEVAELETGQAHSAAEVNAEIAARREAYRQNQALVKKLTEEQTAHDKTLKQLGDELKERPKLMQTLADLQSALGQAGEAKARAAALTERLARWHSALATDHEQRAKLNAEADQYTAILRDSAAKQTALDRLRQEDSVVKAQVMAAQQRLAALEGLIKQRDAKRAQVNQLADDKGLYTELREAFGKKGVPAMMIEAAVPEIETTANALLTKMTSGRMNVRFNTQKETQAGETRETLDIQISDELGTRAYESYSGGEQFRVNFAIRVALSQLLARRAGTQLRTLILDEGFGALDASGRERLVEAINAAQDDFERILVVTHIDELKDAFPTRIEITKGPQGSEIVIV